RAKVADSGCRNLWVMALPFSTPRSKVMPRPLLADDETTSPTVIASRPVSELLNVQEQVVKNDARIAGLMLDLVRQTAAARNDEAEVVSVIADFAFRAFPNATHHVLAVKDELLGEFRPLIARSRSGDAPEVALSRTIVSRVLSEGLTVLITHGQPGLSA